MAALAELWFEALRGIVVIRAPICVDPRGETYDADRAGGGAGAAR